MDDDISNTVDTLVECAHKTIEVLKDPTSAGKVQLSADERNTAREEAADNLSLCIDAMESLIKYFLASGEVKATMANIAAKYIDAHEPSK